MKVTLVNAPPFAIVEPWYDRPDFGRAGLAYLAGYLRQHSDIGVEIIDAKLERLDFEAVVRRVVEARPSVVGLTAFTNEITPAAYAAALIKRALPDCVTVIGGVHVTALPTKTLEQFPSFDIGVVGEGEVTFTELCRALRDGSALSAIPGLVYRDGAKIASTGPRPRILDQDSIPFPAWDLMPRCNTYFLMSLRGCPLNCVFCMNPNGRVARQRTVDNVMEELNLVLDRYHPTDIWWADELFTIDKERTHRLLDAMIAAKVPDRVRWWCQTHVRFVDDDLFQKMKRAGVRLVGLGIETGDEAKLRALGKGTDLAMITKARDAARRAKVPISSFFVLGQPDETIDSIKRTIDFAVKLNPEEPIFGVMVPYPGTEVSRLAAEGKGGYRLKSFDWDDYNKQIGGAMEFADLSRSQIEWLQIQAYVKVFLLNGRFVDFAKFVWQYRRGAWSMAIKAIFGGNHVDSPVRAAARAAIQAVVPLTREDFIVSRADWQQWQTDEMKRSRQHAAAQPVSAPVGS